VRSCVHYVAECTTAGYSVGGVNATCLPCPAFQTLNSTGATSPAFCVNKTGLVNPAMGVTIQMCPRSDRTCQGWVNESADSYYWTNIYAVKLTPNITIQDWQKVDINWPDSFHYLTYAGGNQCMTSCIFPECGRTHGPNIIWSTCFDTFSAQRWWWHGVADANGARMIWSARSYKCITACPAASSVCRWSDELTSDVSSSTCNATDPSQRWVFGPLAEFVG
jgi:hypothetical protein